MSRKVPPQALERPARGKLRLAYSAESETSSAPARRRQRINERRTHAQRRDEVKQHIIAAAFAVIARQGVDGLTLAAVAEEAGYSRGVPGHYFRSKNELIAALAVAVRQKYMQEAKPASELAGLERLLQSIEVYIDPQRGVDPLKRAFHIAMGEAVVDETLSEVMSHLTRVGIASMKTRIEECVERGEISRDVDAQALGVILLGTQRELVRLSLADPSGVDLSALCAPYLATLRNTLAD